MATARSWKIRN